MNKLLNRSKLFLKRNAPTILTCVGAVGVVATTISAVKATPKALELLDEAKEVKGEDLTTFETIRVAGPVYIPTIAIGVSTVACIFGANALNKRQQASLMSAYALLDNSFKEYKNKVIELYGEEADSRVREEIAKDKYAGDGKLSENNKQLFYDEFSGRYFESTMEDVLRAEYNVNKFLSNHAGLYLNEYYDMLKIPRVDYGDYLGWSAAEVYDMCWESWINFDHTKAIIADDLECHIIRFHPDPSFGFEDY